MAALPSTVPSSPIVRRAVEQPPCSNVSASALQQHADARFVLDRAAAARLTRFESPWVVGPLDMMGLEWTDALTRKAVIWLALELGKPILKLTDEDYNEHGLQDLLSNRGRAYDLNIEVFRAMQDTITGWPGGKPGSVRRVRSLRPADGEGPTDPREFWQRAEDRNRDTARLYDKLGLPEYEAIEGFVLHKT